MVLYPCIQGLMHGVLRRRLHQHGLKILGTKDSVSVNAAKRGLQKQKFHACKVCPCHWLSPSPCANGQGTRRVLPAPCRIVRASCNDFMCRFAWALPFAPFGVKWYRGTMRHKTLGKTAQFHLRGTQ